MKRRLVLDTDIGSDVDDALCLALALASPELELIAVTTVSRRPRLRAAIARRLLDLAGRRDVPVFVGCESPLSGGETFVWFGNEGKGILADSEIAAAEPASAGRADESAVDALARLLRSHDDLEICAVGPLTNLGALLRRDAEACRRVRCLTIMGGHLRRVAYGGATFPHGVDYNLCSDADASQEVLGAGLPIRLVTADVTLQTWITPRDRRRLAEHGAPLHAALARAVEAWTPVMGQIFSGFGAAMGDDNAAFLHDPLALASIYDESFCEFADLEVEPGMQDGVFRTIERPSKTRATRRMRCALSVDAPRFRAHFMERVLSL